MSVQRAAPDPRVLRWLRVERARPADAVRGDPRPRAPSTRRTAPGSAGPTLLGHGSQHLLHRTGGGHLTDAQSHRRFVIILNLCFFYLCTVVFFYLFKVVFFYLFKLIFFLNLTKLIIYTKQNDLEIMYVILNCCKMSFGVKNQTYHKSEWYSKFVSVCQLSPPWCNVAMLV